MMTLFCWTRWRGFDERLSGCSFKVDRAFFFFFLSRIKKGQKRKYININIVYMMHALCFKVFSCHVTLLWKSSVNLLFTDTHKSHVHWTKFGMETIFTPKLLVIFKNNYKKQKKQATHWIKKKNVSRKNLNSIFL